MKKLDLYIIKKFLGTFFYAIVIIISISVVFDLSEKIDEFLENKAPLNAIVFDYYLNFIPYFANLFSSLFTFIAVIFFTSKMAARTEIIAILSSGVSFRRLLFPYFISALIIAILSFVLSSYIIPPANATRLAFENTYIRNPYQNRDRNIHRQVLPGVFIYFESYNTSNDVGLKFSIEKFEDGELKSKLMSDFARWDTAVDKWHISNYYIRNFLESGQEEIIQGTQLDTALNIYPKDFKQRVNIVETMSTPRLNTFIEEQRRRGESNIEAYLIEKYKRTASPFSTFILTLIGVAISSRKTRGGIGGHIGIGLALSFTYILFLQISSQFAISGTLSPLIAVWVPNFIYAIIGVFLYRLVPK